MKIFRSSFFILPMLTLGMLLGSPRVHASSISLSGTCSWQVDGSSIDISAQEVANNSSSGVSGTLRLEVWATTTPYAGGTITGYVLGTRTLGTLAAGASFQNITGDVPYTAPPNGNYYTTMTVEEYTTSGYVIRDYVTFSGTSNFGSGSGGGGTETFNLDGPVGWNVSGNNVNITAGSVVNSSSSGVSGTLRLQVWATTSPYTGGTLTGYVMGTRTLGTLAAGFSFTNITGNVPFTAPPAGSYYYTTVVLEEYTTSGYVIVDYVSFYSNALFGYGSIGLGGNGVGSGGGLQLVGTETYSVASKTKISLTAQEVLNDNSSGISGTLRLRLWATTKPYTGGTLTGYVMATRNLGQLDAGYYFSNLSGKEAYKAPPKGNYYVTMTLEEFNGSYNIVDSVNFTGKLKVK